jgi:hypothetical protein
MQGAAMTRRRHVQAHFKQPTVVENRAGAALVKAAVIK